MRKYNIIANPVRVIKRLYGKVICAVLMNGRRGELRVGIEQGCHSSPILFNIMPDALEEHNGKLSIIAELICSLPMTVTLLLNMTGKRSPSLKSERSPHNV